MRFIYPKHLIPFLKRIFVFAFLFFIADKGAYYFIWKAPGLETDTRLEEVIQGRMHKDILVFGSSRGARNIIAGRLGELLKRSAFNLSYPGSDIAFHEFVLRSVLKYNPAPALVVLAVDDSTELLYDEFLTFRFDRMYPLVKYPYINNELIAHGEKNYMSKYLMLLRVTKSQFFLRQHHFSALDSIAPDGSMPIFAQKKNCRWRYVSNRQEYDEHIEIPEKVAAFDSFVQLCADRNIPLCIVFSPNYQRHNFSFEKRIRNLGGNRADYFVYDTARSEFSDRAYFHDEGHLLINGATLFTEALAAHLAQLEKGTTPAGSGPPARTALR